ncbi:MAG: hypothetical protein RLZZ528_612 [Pseudomonadota bacterium]
MFAISSFRRRIARPLLAVAAALALAACQPTTGTGGAGLDLGKPVQVALLVPGGSADSGDQVVARSLTQAAQLAASEVQGVQIDLRVYNTGADAGSTASAAATAVEEGAKIILGPVYADAANAAGNAVASSGVNVLSFSNNTDIAGGNVFVLGPTFQNSADRLVAQAVRSGRRSILIVHDRTPAGDLGRRAIETAIARNGASSAGAVSYEFSQQGVISAIPSIAAAAKTGGASAIFFTADTAGALPLLTQLVTEAGVSPATTKFIGLTRWDIPAATLSLPGVRGGWFALPDPGLANQFSARYTAAYGEVPPPIAGLAYDGIAAIAALARSGTAGGLSAAGLTQGSGFAGVTGVFRFRPDGTNERGIAVAEIQNGQVVVIDPAPRSFGGAGF